ncbi:hypothetical protein EM595_p0128 (plasmid) [Duffyella gerundensis]|uniref:Uncharacterized protein n=1 Tax=Duffyella gerundensis TaxID=1619313 RepID=A0A0U5GSH1_9GAMM|nr:hypothetical protein EM595_p0128 [Duffyella gerundensis]
MLRYLAAQLMFHSDKLSRYSNPVPGYFYFPLIYPWFNN